MVGSKPPNSGSKSFPPLCLLTDSSNHGHYSLFTRVQGSSFVALLVYVDDIVLASNDPEAISQLTNFLNNQFRLKDLSPLKFFLGIEIARSAKGISICQRKYALEILNYCGLLAAKPTKFPMDSNLKLSQSDGELLDDPAVYRRLVGRLLYLTITRLDLSYAVQSLSQFMAHPRQPQLHAAYSVLRYLKISPGQGPFFPSSSQFHLKAFCDLDWAGSLILIGLLVGIVCFWGIHLSPRNPRSRTLCHDLLPKPNIDGIHHL